MLFFFAADTQRPVPIHRCDQASQRPIRCDLDSAMGCFFAMSVVWHGPRHIRSHSCRAELSSRVFASTRQLQRRLERLEHLLADVRWWLAGSHIFHLNRSSVRWNKLRARCRRTRDAALQYKSMPCGLSWWLDSLHIMLKSMWRRHANK